MSVQCNVRTSQPGTMSRYRGYCVRKPENEQEKASPRQMWKTSQVWNLCKTQAKLIYALDPAKSSHSPNFAIALPWVGQ